MYILLVQPLQPIVHGAQQLLSPTGDHTRWSNPDHRCSRGCMQRRPVFLQLHTRSKVDAASLAASVMDSLIIHQKRWAVVIVRHLGIARMFGIHRERLPKQERCERLPIVFPRLRHSRFSGHLEDRIRWRHETSANHSMQRTPQWPAAVAIFTLDHLQIQIKI